MFWGKKRLAKPASPSGPGGAGLWGRNGGIYLGYAADQLQGPAPALTDELAYNGDRHIVSIGPNGSGKSRRLLKPNLVRLTDWSMLVVDPKAELAAMTAAHRRAKGNQVILLNPFNLFGLGSDGFNPIMALNPDDDDFPDDALTLADAVIKLSPNDHEPHWAASAQDLVTALIMYARLKPVASRDDDTIEARGNFGFVRSCLGKTAKRFRWKTACKTFQIPGVNSVQ
jgi:type IV secretion system protein VirD4